MTNTKTTTVTAPPLVTPKDFFVHRWGHVWHVVDPVTFGSVCWFPNRASALLAAAGLTAARATH